MEIFIPIIKWIALIQLGLLTFLVIFIYGLRILKSRLDKRKKVKTEQLILQLKTNPQSLLKQKIKNADKLSLLINTMKCLESVETSSLKDWSHNKQIILSQLILPQVRKYIHSGNWYKRYLACQAFLLDFEEQDIPLIKQLLADEVDLIQLNAAIVIFLKPSQQLIDEVIQSFTKSRRLQRGLFLQTLNLYLTPKTLPFIAKHLNESNNIYAKILCYQLLSEQPAVPQPVKKINDDIYDSNIDLQIAALTYYCYINPHQAKNVLSDKLESPHWQVRARMATLVGKIGERALIPLLDKHLKDNNWWVRMNSAKALANFGKEGLNVLKKQTPSEDRFAYDAAEFVLATHSNTPVVNRVIPAKAGIHEAENRSPPARR